MRRAGRRDLLHVAVGKVFHDHGWDTLDLADVGDGVPDWLMARGAFAVLVEVKSPNKVRHGRAENPFTADQESFRARWRGPIFTVDSLEATWALVEQLQERKAVP